VADVHVDQDRLPLRQPSRCRRSKYSISTYTPPSINSPGETTSWLGSELKGESRVDSVVAMAALFVH